MVEACVCVLAAAAGVAAGLAARRLPASGKAALAVALAPAGGAWLASVFC